MAQRAISIVVAILLVLVVLAVALWLLEIITGLVGSLIVGVLVVLGILYLVRAFKKA